MSMEIYIFTKKESIPNPTELQIAIHKAGFNYTLAEKFDTKSEEFNFWMGSFEGLESGCDYVVDSYNTEDWDFNTGELELIGNADCVVTLGAFSNAQEIVAMQVIASVLTEMTGAVMLSDFFWDEFIKADEAVSEAARIVENSREQFNGPSSTRAAVLSQENDEPDEEMQAFAAELQQSLQERIDQAFGNIQYGLSEGENYENGLQFAKEVRNSLKEAGISLDTSLDLAFYLYLKDKESAENAKARIEEIDLKCHIEQEDVDDDTWLCYSARYMKPEEKRLETIGELMITLADEYNGNFDGWETVPEFGFNPFFGEYEAEKCEDMARKILDDTRHIHTPPHTFINADLTKFADLDIETYDIRQQEYEAAGFELLGDMENKTISDMGQIVTFMRVMYHPKEQTIGYFYHVGMFDLFIDQLGTDSEEGTFYVTTNSPFSDEDNTIQGIDLQMLPGSEFKELLDAHLSRIDKTVTRKPIDTIEKYIASENSLVAKKRDALQAVGWVTKEMILKNSGGDETLTECVYDALQRILALKS